MARVDFDLKDGLCSDGQTRALETFVGDLCKAMGLDPEEWGATVQLHKFGEPLPCTTVMFGPESEKRIQMILSAVGSDIDDSIGNAKVNYLAVAKRALQLAFGDKDAQFIVLALPTNEGAQVIPMDGIPPFRGGLRPMGGLLIEVGQAVKSHEEKLAKLAQQPGTPN